MRRLLVLSLVVVSACEAREAAGVETALDLGPNAVRVVVSAPAGWEVLDQGAKKRFRKGELEIVLQSLGKTEITDLDQLADWGLPQLGSRGDKERREVKSRQRVSVRHREAIDVETWNRLDHTWPQRYLFMRAGDDAVAMHTPRLADADTVKAFESVRDSIYFVISERR